MSAETRPAAALSDSAAVLPDSKARLRFWLRLLKATRLIEAELRENLRVEFGSTLPRFDVMAALERSLDGLKMSELSSVLKVANGNVTGIVDRLVEDGYLVRSAVPGDRRATRVRLTKKGQEEFARQAAAHERWIDNLLGMVDPAMAARLSTSLEKIAQRPAEEQGE